MKLKTIAAAAAALLVAFGANAADADWGTHPTTTVLTGAWNAGNFLDTYSFSLDSTASVTSSVLSFGNTLGGNYSVWSFGTDGLFGTADDTQLGIWGLSTLASLPAASHTLSLDAGSYYYAVGGRALAGGAAYALSSTAVAAPVPEPETYALLGAGLGIVGFVASRRRRDD